MKKARETKIPIWLELLVIALLVYLGFLTGSIKVVQKCEFLDALLYTSNNFYKFFLIRFNDTSATYGFLAGIIGWIALEWYKLSVFKNLKGAEYGSSHWNDPKYTEQMREIGEDAYLKNWIMTKTDIVSKNMSKTGKNRNCLIIGKPGSGKSRYWVKPNVLSTANETLIVTDPKGELLASTGAALKEMGMDIRVLNLQSKWCSDHYNPFHYIRRYTKDQLLDKYGGDEKAVEAAIKSNQDIVQDDVMTLINTLMEATKSDTLDSSSGDPFWEKAESLFLQSIFYYILYNEQPRNQNFQSVLRCIREAKMDQNGNSPLGKRFELWRAKDPDNVGIKQWDHFMVTANSPKMMSTIITTASTRLGPFNIEEIKDLTIDDTMDFDRIGKPGKEGSVAYFIITEPNNNTFNFLANLMYRQIFTIMDRNAKENGGSLATPCNLYMDEWRQLGKIPRFVENLSYVRGLNVGITVIVQSISQLKEVYKDGWETIVDDCDYLLFLGSGSNETLKYMEEKLGKQTLTKESHGRSYGSKGSTSKNRDVYERSLAQAAEIARMPKGYGMLLIQGIDPFYSELYDLSKHPRYNKLWEPWTEEKGNKDPKFKSSKKWIENHELYYDHLEEIKKRNRENQVGKFFKDFFGDSVVVYPKAKVEVMTEAMEKEIESQELVTDFSDL